jgi:DNA-binding IclR family transcriptional regulator
MEHPRLLPERRRRARGTPLTPQRQDLIARVLGSFREMPGLRLTLEQAARLMGLDTTSCRAVLDALVQLGQLRRLPSGGYALPETT